MPRSNRRSGRRRQAGQSALFDEEPEMPYGLLDLDPTITTDRGPPLRIRCVVRDCPHLLMPPTRSTAGRSCTTSPLG